MNPEPVVATDVPTVTPTSSGAELPGSLTSGTGEPQPASTGSARSFGIRGLARWEVALFATFVAVFIVGRVLSPEFLTNYNFFNMGLSNGELAIMALPMTLIIVTGEIDLSVSSTLGLASSLLGLLWMHGWPMPAVIVVVLICGAFLGAFNGFLVTRVGLPSIAVTIGTMLLYAGIAEILLGSNIVSNFPATYTNLGVYGVPGIGLSYSTVIFFVLAIIFGVVLHFTPFGRSLFAMGANQEAAIFSGLRVKRTKMILYIVSGVVCSGAGILYTFRLSTAEYDNGTGLVLSVVAIVLLGGVSIFGGKGSMVGVVFAVLIYSGLLDALLLTGFPQQASGIVIGGLLLLSVLVPSVPEFRARFRAGRHRLRKQQVPEAAIVHSGSVARPLEASDSGNEVGRGGPSI
ncbi:MAG: ABC transporter permease [Acidimicrobiales bacterium]|jgi:rhamnose transport system permease protein